MASPNLIQSAASGFTGGRWDVPSPASPINDIKAPEPVNENFAEEAKFEQDALNLHLDTLNQRMEGVENVESLDTLNGQLQRGYVDENDNATPSGELFLNLVDSGLVNESDGTLTQKGQAFTLPAEDALKEQNYELWKIRQQHELDDVDVPFDKIMGGLGDMVGNAIMGAWDMAPRIWMSDEQRVKQDLAVDATVDGAIKTSARLGSGASTLFKSAIAKATGAEDDYYRAKFKQAQFEKDINEVNMASSITDVASIEGGLAESVKNALVGDTFDVAGRRETAETHYPDLLKQQDERGAAFADIFLDPSMIATTGAGWFIAKGTKMNFAARMAAGQAKIAESRVIQLNAAQKAAAAETKAAKLTAGLAAIEGSVAKQTALGMNPGKLTNYAAELKTRAGDAVQVAAKAQDDAAKAQASLSATLNKHFAADAAQQLAGQVQRAKAIPAKAVAAVADDIGEKLIKWDDKIGRVATNLGMDAVKPALKSTATAVGAGMIATPGVGVAVHALTHIGAYGKLARGVSNFSRIMGEELMQRRGAVPFWQRVANNSAATPISSATAHAIDNAMLGSVGRKIGRTAKDIGKGIAAATPVDMAFEVVYNGGDFSANAMKQAFAESIVFGGTGAAAGSAVYGNRRNLQTQQVNDELSFRESLPPEQAQMFGQMNPGARKLLATVAAISPALNVRIDKSGPSSMNRQTNTMTINPNRADFLRPIVAHELGHYVAIKAQAESGISAMLVGVPIDETGNTTGGILRSPDGTLDPSFKAFSDEYNSRLEVIGKPPLSHEDMAVEYYVDAMTDDLLGAFDSGAVNRRAGRSTVERAALEGMKAVTYKAPIIGSLLRSTGTAKDSGGRIVKGTGVTAQGVITMPGMRKMVKDFTRHHAGLRRDTSLDVEKEEGGIPMSEVNKNPLLQEQLFSFYQTDKSGKVLRDAQGNALLLTRQEMMARTAVGLQLIEMQQERAERGELIPDGELKPDGKGGVEGTHLNPAQIKKLADSGHYNAKQVAALRQLNRGSKRNIGETFMVIYQAATRPRKNRAKGYATLPVTFREVVPVGISITKDGNIIVGLMSVTQLTNNIQKRANSARGKRLYDGDQNKIREDVEAVMNLHRTGTETDSYFNQKYGAVGKERKNFINTVFGLMSKAQQDVNPIFTEDSVGYKDNVFKTYRLDRINQTTQIQGRHAMPFQYDAVKVNLLPHEPTQNDGNQEQTETGTGRENLEGNPVDSYQGREGSHLEGLPQTVKADGQQVRFTGLKSAQDTSKRYVESAGIPYVPIKTYAKVNPERATRIAQAFEEMKHDPQNPEVKESYRAMIDETYAQYDAMIDAGVEVEFNPPGPDPYGNPRNAILDVVQNNHMYVFPTKDGFGSDAEFDPKDNPLMEVSPYKWKGQTVLANDVFRAVHDYFGHIRNGVGFRARGEENAWRSHATMFSPKARRAATTETRGQNSWLKYGPYGETNRTAKVEDTHFADQKIGLMPDWTMEDDEWSVDNEGKINYMPEPTQDNEKFIEEFVEAANELTSIPLGSKSGLGGYDTSFHVTTKIKHLLGTLRTQVFDRAIKGAKKRGKTEKVAVLQKRKKKTNGVTQFLRGKFADYISNFPDKQSVDLRTGKEVDPYQVVKDFFPDGEPGHIEDDIREIAQAIKAVKGSQQDVLNLAELANMNGVDLEEGFMEEREREWLASRDMTPEQFKKAEEEAYQMLMNPEFNDVTQLKGGGTLSTPIDPEANLMPEPKASDIPMSAVNVLHNDSDVLPKPSKKKKNAQVAELLKEKATEFWGREVTSNDITAEEIELITQMGVQEFEAAFQASGKSAANWYSTAIKAAMEVAGVIHPEIVDPTAAAAAPGFAKQEDPQQAADLTMRTALAITSQNLSVELNTRFAEEQFEIFKKKGRFDDSKVYGEKAESISGNLRLANVLFDKMGHKKAEEFIRAEFTVRDLEKASAEILNKETSITGKKDDILNGAAMFGPKIGQGFLQNVMGNFDPVTIDLWMRRTWGRWTGDVVGAGATPERLGKLLDAVKGTGMDVGLLKGLRAVTRERKSGAEYLTVSDAVADRLENDDEFNNQIMDVAKRLHAQGQANYKLSTLPVTPEMKESVESGDLSYNNFIRSQRLKSAKLDKDFNKAKARAKKKGEKVPAKAGWAKEWFKKKGFTSRISSAGKIKQEWDKKATVIVNASKPIDIPAPQDRRVISSIVNDIRERLEAKGYDTSNADVQAVLWYPEKDLWAKLRGEDESNLKSSYDEEFIKVAEKKGLGDQARSRAASVGAEVQQQPTQ